MKWNKQNICSYQGCQEVWRVVQALIVSYYQFLQRHNNGEGCTWVRNKTRTKQRPDYKVRGHQPAVEYCRKENPCGYPGWATMAQDSPGWPRSQDNLPAQTQVVSCITVRLLEMKWSPCLNLLGLTAHLQYWERKLHRHTWLWHRAPCSDHLSPRSPVSEWGM